MKRFSKLFRIIVAVVVIVLTIWQISQHIEELSSIPSVLASVRLPFIILGLGFVVVSYLTDGLMVRSILTILGYPIQLSQTLRISMLDIFSAQTLPIGQLGAVATSYYFYRKLGVSKADCVLLSGSWAFLTVMAEIVLFLLSIAFLPAHPAEPFLAHGFRLVVGGIALLFLVGFGILIVVHHTRWQTWYRSTIHRLFGRQSLRTIIRSYLEKVATDRQAAIIAVGSAFAYYLVEILCLKSTLAAAYVSAPFTVVTFALFSSYFATFISLIPGGIGIAESTLVVILIQFGYRPAGVITGVLLYRLLSLWLPFVVGFINYFSLMNSGFLVPMRPWPKNRFTSK